MNQAVADSIRRSGLADTVAEHLLEDIVSGVYPPLSQLPPEPELAERAGVSRLTLREAIKDLRQRGVVEVQQGRGTFVTHPERWSQFDSAVLNARAATEEGYELAHELTELRRVFERGVAEFAAVRRTEEDLARMAEAIEAMKEAWEVKDVDAFASADLDFHDALLRAARNTFALALFHSIHGALRAVRRRTTLLNAGELSEHAIEYHTRILAACRRRSPRAAAALMDEHLRETETFTAELAAKSAAERRKAAEAASSAP